MQELTHTHVGVHTHTPHMHTHTIHTHTTHTHLGGSLCVYPDHILCTRRSIYCVWAIKSVWVVRRVSECECAGGRVREGEEMQP